MEKYLIEEMTSQEMAEASEVVDTVLVPLGTIEQHGPHLPVGTDVLIPVKIAKRVAKKAKVLIVPAHLLRELSFHAGDEGVCHDHSRNPSISALRLVQVAREARV